MNHLEGKKTTSVRPYQIHNKENNTNLKI